jgi:hypothetical protein
MDPDLAAPLLTMEELKRKEPTTTRIQTPLPPAAGHHGRRQRGRERPAGRKKEELSQSKSPQGVFFSRGPTYIIVSSRQPLERFIKDRT